MSKNSLAEDYEDDLLNPQNGPRIQVILTPEKVLDLYDNLSISGKRLNSLPQEVLAEIFYRCVPTAKDQKNSSPRFAMTLSQICKRWRFVALSTPSLWTYTKVEIPRHQLSPASELMGLYLERSKTCPIFIDINFGDIWVHYMYRSAMSFFQEVIDFVRQYRPVNVLANSCLSTHLEAKSSEDMATLSEQYFWVARQVVKGVPPAARLRREIGQESLVTIRASRVAKGSFVLDPYLSWSSSLTSLEIKAPSHLAELTVSAAVSVLATFPLLVHCALHVHYDDAEPLQVMHVTLMNLQNFTLCWSEWVDCGRLLDVLSAPNVEELELSGYVPETAHGGEWMHLVHFLQRNRPPLKHLKLEEIDCFHVSLKNALLCTPQLESLWLENCILDDNLIRSIYTDGTLITDSLLKLVFVSCYKIDLEVLTSIIAYVKRKRREKGKQDLIVFVDGCNMSL